jgi:hypothetical protein
VGQLLLLARRTQPVASLGATVHLSSACLTCILAASSAALSCQHAYCNKNCARLILLRASQAVRTRRQNIPERGHQPARGSHTSIAPDSETILVVIGILNAVGELLQEQRLGFVDELRGEHHLVCHAGV